MYFFLGIVISGLMIGTPMAFAVDIGNPPTQLTGWLVFVISLCGVLGLLQLGLVKFILKPAILDEMKLMLSRLEFNLHVKSNDDFRKEVEIFMDDVRGHTGLIRRHRSEPTGESFQ